MSTVHKTKVYVRFQNNCGFSSAYGYLHDTKIQTKHVTIFVCLSLCLSVYNLYRYEVTTFIFFY